MNPTGSSRTEIRIPGVVPGNGDSRTTLLPGDIPLSDDQPTIISKNILAIPAENFRAMNPAELGRTLVGERLGHFQLQDFIGGGGMGAVFRALDTMLNRIVAVKVLSQSQASDDETLKRFKNEAQSAARLDHDNISRVYYVGEDRGLHYIVFEYIEGTNLRDLVIQDGPLSIQDAISYTLQITDALDHASRRDVVHRDIKPSNVLITLDGKAKLVDMGLARLHQIAQPEEDLTASGVTLGTFDYISPEQARDPRNADVRSDLYSLGCTLYYVLTGQPPFPEGTVLQKLLQHQGDEPLDPRDFRPDLPDELYDITKKLMAKAPTSRYQTPGELAADLLALSADLGIQPAGGEAALRLNELPDRAQFWQHNLPWIASVVSLLVIVIALNWVWSRGNSEDDVLPSIAVRKKTTTVTPDRGTPTVAGHEPISPTNSGNTPENKAHEIPNHVAVANLSAGVRRMIEKRLNAGAAEVRLEETQQHWQSHEELAGAAWQRGETAGSVISRSHGLALSTDPSPVIPRKDVLVVAGPDDDPDTFTTLRAACNAAKNNSIIELRFNGRLEEKPLTLPNAKIKIRAAEGFAPIVVFRPREDQAGATRAMISMTGGQLTLLNMVLEMELSAAAIGDGWTLFETQRAESIRLENCWLTLKNAGLNAQHNATFFDVRMPAGGEALMAAGATAPSGLNLELKNCVARGEATFVRANDLLPVHVTWENGLLAVSEWLLSRDNAEVAPRAAATVTLELRHLTCATNAGVIRLFNQSELNAGRDLDLRCEDNIFVGTGNSVFLDQMGMVASKDLQKRVEWDGSRNFYEDYLTYWNARGNDDEEIIRTRKDWAEYWGATREKSDDLRVGWQAPLEPGRVLHAALLSDYQMSAGEDNPARGAAGDGKNVGCILEAMPVPPSEK